MHRSPRVLLAWSIVVVVAIATARLVATDLAALHRRARNFGPDVQVMLAARDLPLGATITPGDIRTVTRPASTLPPDAMRDVKHTLGRVVAVGFVRDDLVREVHLAPADRVGIDGVVAVGRRAMHAVIKDGFRPPLGAVVDVFATFDPTVSAAGARNTATTVARGARVLGVDEAAGSAAGGGPGVTLLVAEAEAGAVAYAAGNGDISLAIAPPETACCTSSSTSSTP